ncbi:MAG: MBL fold metallo-hydrolase [Deltaproteobacteria bacterium]|nr:MBL fold metallo-hydrolase [Deltaproteobacteria bacterium]
MKISFLGGTGTVTGSKYLIQFNGKNYLVDCGLFQGLKALRLRNWEPLPIPANTIEAVVLTHAHIDHSGYLPLLVKNDFRGPIYATEGTTSLAKIMLPDSGYLQEEDAQFINKHRLSKHSPALPLYTQADAEKALGYFKPTPWNTEVNLAPQLRFSFQPAGHIVGASMIRFDFNHRSMIFSGDLGRPHSPIIPAPYYPTYVDYLIVESTYGGRTHPKENPLETLKRYLQITLNRQGTVLIPAFAIGRAQELLYLLSKLKAAHEIPDVPIYLNSPMAIDATRLYCDFLKNLTLTPAECDAICNVAKFVTSVEASKRLNTSTDPCVIISASGMATGGRVLHHLKFLAPNPKNLVLFSGFQAAGTRGEAMLHGVKEVRIHGAMVPVRCEVASIDSLSAHADENEILGWLQQFKKPPRMTFLTHGEPTASEALRQKIEWDLKWACNIPDYLETIDFN